MKYVVVAILLGISSGHSWASSPPFTAPRLVRICTSDELSDSVMCFAYIQGVADVLRLGTSIGINRACPPDDAQLSQLGRQFIRWYRLMPRPDAKAALVVAEALAAEYPCR